ncbi:PBECR2 nuclease fold domain-containing protein [Allorhizobium pseudoryzae]|uniref:PBECR2 nuclease fold domain-containing protein n=1 Tax=Allorhizobium pseudoryzae TaxID=379684 RepID=UPI003D01764E
MADQIPFQEAIDFLRGKVNLPTKKYDDVLRQGQVRAFTVAGVTRDDMLSDFRAATEKARIEGTGFNEFRKDFDAIVDRTGWAFNARGETDEDRRDWRARIIYTTNMRTSYMAGRWARLTDPDVLKYRPYLQYVHSGAEHPRLQHLAWNGLVLSATDPAWTIMYPPNGWGCGCDVKALSRRDLARLGKDGPDPAPNLEPYESFDRRTGRPELRYPGIDRGWDYNVGQEWLGGIVPKELRAPLPSLGQPAKPVNLPPMPEPVTASASDILPGDRRPDEYVDAFLARFGLRGNEVGYHRDASGGVIAISRSLFQAGSKTEQDFSFSEASEGQGPFARLIADAIIKPDEIWVDWASAATGIVLRRSYLRRVLLPDGRTFLVRFQWTKLGWIAVSRATAPDAALDTFRTGSLIYRRPEA